MLLSALVSGSLPAIDWDYSTTGRGLPMDSTGLLFERIHHGSWAFFHVGSAAILYWRVFGHFCPHHRRLFPGGNSGYPSCCGNSVGDDDVQWSHAI